MTLIEDRPEFVKDLPASVSTIANVTPAEFIRQRQWQGDEALVIVSRNHDIDREALAAALEQTGAGYVGMIGSKRRVATVLRHLAEESFPIEALERVYTPIGFDIGAETPEEIAVAIMAEIINVRRGGSGRPMREGRARIVPGEVGVAE